MSPTSSPATAPKSVSVSYAASVDAVKDAYDDAVISVVRHMERHNSIYRTAWGLKPGKLVAAKFDHATSRNIDPQLHSHLFVLNLGTDPGRRLEDELAQGIYQNLKSLGSGSLKRATSPSRAPGSSSS